VKRFLALRLCSALVLAGCGGAPVVIGVPAEARARSAAQARYSS
jgi:hypothetical protein